MTGWTIITDSGLQMVADSLFTEAEARAWVTEYPTTPNGTKQYAVPNHIAHEAQEARAAIQADAESFIAKAQAEAVKALFQKDWSKP